MSNFFIFVNMMTRKDMMRIRIIMVRTMLRKMNKAVSFLLTILLVFMLICTIPPVAVHAAVGDTGATGIWKWRVQNDNTLTITGCTQLSGGLELPSTLTVGAINVAVTRIEDDAFRSTDSFFLPKNLITSFIMPDSVTSVGDRVFYKCEKLESVTLSQNLENIGNSMFYNCYALESVTIPDSVESIGSKAFSGCSSLTDVILSDNSNLGTIGSLAFTDSVLQSIRIPNTVTAIGDGAFSACRSLVSITLPDNTGFMAIPYQMFFECEALESLTIPANVTSIGADALNGCDVLADITVDSNNTVFSSEDGVLYNADKTVLICHPSGRSGTFDIPDTVKEIGAYAFLNSARLTAISIPDGVTTIREGAFFNCNKAVFPDDVLPDSVTSIGSYAFNACNRLAEIAVPEGITGIGEYTFYNCTYLSVLTLPQSLTSVGKGAFMGCDSLTDLRIPKNVTSIGDSAFAFCSKLKKLYLFNEGSLTFGNNIFSYTPNIKTAGNGFLGYGGSSAEVYAASNSIPFYILCTVSFNTNGGSDVPKAFAASGSAIGIPLDPTRSGYSFSGWFKDAECTQGWDFVNDKAVGDITLYAKWTQIQTYALTITAGAGGSVNGVSSGDYPAGAAVNITAIPSANYSFSQWTSTGGGTFGSTASAVTTFIMPANAATITAIFTPAADHSGNHGGGAGGAASSEPSKPVTTGNTTTATTATTAKVDGSGRAAAAVTKDQLNSAVNSAVTEAKKQGDGIAAVVEIKVEAPANSNSVETSIPNDAVGLAASGGMDALKVSTPVASITFDTGALAGINKEAAGDVTITTAKVDASTLTDDTKELVGDRPVFNFSVVSGNNTISEFGGNVTVAVPYTPKAGEDTDAIVIYYVNSEGKPEAVANCKYDPVTKTVTFTTDHFSKYAVGYNKVGFSDVKAGVWYENAVDFASARGIVTGTGNGNFDPAGKLTRGQMLVMLMRAYGFEPDTDLSGNFSDAGNTYYSGYLAAAKRLGITGGVGNNLYAPDKQITRQEMFALLYNTLNVLGRLPEGTETAGGAMTGYSDADSVASWAKAASAVLADAGVIGGSNGKLNPKNTTTRAEMVQVLYNLLSK